MYYEDLFEEVGHFGKYQVWLYLLLGLPSVFPGYQNVLMNFLGAKQDHWCSIPRLANFSNQQQKYISIPLDDDGNYKSCKVYDIGYNNYTDQQLLNWNRSLFENVTQKSCSAWNFDKSEFISTAISQYNLVCDRSWMVQLISTIYLFGIFLGAVFGGALSDRFGRKWVIFAGMIGLVVFSFAAAFAPNYAVFIILRCFSAASNSMAFLSSFVLIMEIIGKDWRVQTGVFYQIFFSIGFMLLPGVAYLIRDSRRLQICLSLFPVVTLIFPWVIPESPRWLMVQGKRDECLEIFRRIGRINGRPLSNNIKLEFEKEEDKVDEKRNLLHLFKTPTIRKRILILYLIWFTCVMMYYGLSLNVGQLSGNVFLNTFLSGAVEIPANIICILTLTKIGRRLPIGLGLLVASVLQYSQMALLLTKRLAWLMTTLAMLGKAGVTCAFSGIYVMTAELIPTEIRNVGVGSASTVARIGGMGSPYVGGPLRNAWIALPQVIFGTLAALSGLSTFILPETRNKNIPDTVEEAEAFGASKLKSEELGQKNMGFSEDSSTTNL